MRISRSLAIVGGSLTAVLAGPGIAASAVAPAPKTHVVGHAYVNDNTTGSNTVGVFDRHSDGTLTPTAGGPFAIGGAGSGANLGSQGALQESSDGQYLLAVDAGSNQISVAKIKADGTLKPIGLVSSGGIDPVSIGIVSRSDRRDLVYVANAGAGGSDYTGFTLGDGGRLRPLAGSTIPLPDGSTPGDILFNSAGTLATGTRVGTSLLDSFTVNRDGTLTAAPGSPYKGQGLGQIGAEFRPTNDNQLFVSNAHNGAGLGTVSAYQVAATGALASVTLGPVADGQTAPCWIEISHYGKYLFAVNTASPSVSSYGIASDGSLTLLGTIPLSTITQSGPVDTRLSPDGSTLFLTSRDSQSVSSFAVDGGTLTPVAGSPVKVAGATAPTGLVVT